MEIMKKLHRHIRRWNVWRNRNANGRLHHVLVLFGIVKSPTFVFTMLPEEIGLDAVTMEVSNAISKFGVNADEASKALREFTTHIPPFSEDDILRIKANPSLSPVEKIRIIRNMRKQM